MAETLAKQLLRDLHLAEEAMLEACLRRLEQPAVMSRGLVPAEVVSLLHAARVLGNKAAHGVLKIEVGGGDVALILGLLLAPWSGTSASSLSGSHAPIRCSRPRRPQA